LNSLEKGILIGKVYKAPDIYSQVISKQTTVFYRLRETQTIELVFFWNNQQNPDTLKKLLKP